jgi:hypothetical protein
VSRLELCCRSSSNPPTRSPRMRRPATPLSPNGPLGGGYQVGAPAASRGAGRRKEGGVMVAAPLIISTYSGPWVDCHRAAVGLPAARPGRRQHHASGQARHGCRGPAIPAPNHPACSRLLGEASAGWSDSPERPGATGQPPNPGFLGGSASSPGTRPEGHQHLGRATGGSAARRAPIRPPTLEPAPPHYRPPARHRRHHRT